MSAVHYNAMKAQLQAGANLSDKVSDTARMDASGVLVRDSYLVLYGGAPDLLDSNRYAAAQMPDSDAEFVYTVRAVSLTPGGVRDIQAAAVAQLVGFVPAITGRRCAPVRLTQAREVQPDNTIQPPLFYADTEYTLTSLKA